MMKKGQSEMVGHTIAVLLSIILVSSISLLMSQIYSTHLKAEIEEELNGIGRTISCAISEIYGVSENLDYLPRTNESLKLVEFRLKLPSNVVNRNYEISFNSDKRNLTLKTLQEPEVIVKIEIPKFGMEFEGKSKNGLNSTLSLRRVNLNGEIKNFIIFEAGEE